MSRYIDKVDLLEWLERVDGCIADGTVEAPTLYKQMITDINNFATADVVEVRHGVWKKLYDKAPRYVCTACNHLFNNKEYKYCPNCGAKMDGERKKENE